MKNRFDWHIKVRQWHDRNSDRFLQSNSSLSNQIFLHGRFVVSVWDMQIYTAGTMPIIIKVSFSHKLQLSLGSAAMDFGLNVMAKTFSQSVCGLIGGHT